MSRQLKKAILGLEELESRRVLSLLGSPLGAIASVVSSVAAAANGVASAAVATPAASSSSSVQAPASASANPGSLVTGLLGTVSATISDTVAVVSSAATGVVTQVSATLSTTITQTVNALDSVSASVSNTLSVTVSIFDTAVSGTTDPTSGSGSETLNTGTGNSGTGPGSLTSIFGSASPTGMIVSNAPASSPSNSFFAVPAGTLNTDPSSASTFPGSFQSLAGNVAASQNGLVLSPVSSQIGLIAFPNFATGLNLTNYNQMITLPPATGLLQPVPQRPQLSQDNVFLRDLERDLSVPTLQFFGELGPDTEEEPEAPQNLTPGAWLEPLPEHVPQAMGLLGNASTVDNSLDQALRQFLDGLEDIGQVVAQALLRQGWLPWALGAGAVGALAVELSRPRRRTRARALAFGLDHHPPSWVPGLPGSIAIEEG